MDFFAEYPHFVNGCFYDRNYKLAGRISGDKKHVVEYSSPLNIIGKIENGNLYDRGLNKVGYFKDGTLYDWGGNPRGRYWGKFEELEKREDKEDNNKGKKEDEGKNGGNFFDFWLNLVLYGIIVVGTIILGNQFAAIFFS